MGAGGEECWRAARIVPRDFNVMPTHAYGCVTTRTCGERHASKIAIPVALVFVCGYAWRSLLFFTPDLTVLN